MRDMQKDKLMENIQYIICASFFGVQHSSAKRDRHIMQSQIGTSHKGYGQDNMC